MLHTVMPLARAASIARLLYPVPASQMSFTESGNRERREASMTSSLVTTTAAPRTRSKICSGALSG